MLKAENLSIQNTVIYWYLSKKKRERGRGKERIHLFKASWDDILGIQNRYGKSDLYKKYKKYLNYRYIKKYM